MTRALPPEPEQRWGKGYRGLVIGVLVGAMLWLLTGVLLWLLVVHLAFR